jgi:HEPN domain-containing protein
MPELDPATPAPEEAEQWIAKARDDLAVARVLPEHPVGANWATCFHAQQAAEKALKGVLVAAGVDFPKTHALERLHDLLPAAVASEFDRASIAALSPWAVAGLYPEDIPDATTTTAHDLVVTAAAIVDLFARQVL